MRHREPLSLPSAGRTVSHFRIRHDTVDQIGKLTPRHDNPLHHLGIGRVQAGTPVLILMATTTVTVIGKPDTPATTGAICHR